MIPGFRVIALAATACVLTGCGRGDPIPPEAAGSLVRGLDNVEQKVRAGECRQARPPLRRLDQTARTLPESIDEGTQETLESGVGHLRELVKTQCKQKPKPRREKKAPRMPSPPVQRTPQPQPRVIEPPAQSEPTPEPPQSDTQPTPDPQQPPTPAQPEMPEMPEIPDLPDLPN